MTTPSWQAARAAAFPQGRHVSASSLLADQHMSDALVEITKDTLAGEGIAVSSVNLLGWEARRTAGAMPAPSGRGTRSCSPSTRRWRTRPRR